MSEITSQDGRPLTIVGTYPTRTEAYERALVVSAMEIPHWILKHEGTFVLCVDPGRETQVSEELRRFEAERVERSLTVAEPAVWYSTISLWVCGWILAGLYAVQVVGPAWWTDRGAASSREIVHGKWWEAFTALTLHADLGHLGANLAAGLIYAAFLLPIFGAGWTWFLVVLAGGLGNWVNAWGYRDIEHLSIGASTSVFAALGILVGAQCALRTMALRQIRAREFLVPIGAGLALLGYLGVGDQQTDFMAHFFGFVAGLPMGFAGAGLRLGTRTPRWVQVMLAWSAPAIIALCWWLAAR